MCPRRLTREFLEVEQPVLLSLNLQFSQVWQLTQFTRLTHFVTLNNQNDFSDQNHIIRMTTARGSWNSLCQHSPHSQIISESANSFSCVDRTVEQIVELTTWSGYLL